MEKKNILIVVNLRGAPKATIVRDFSDENVKEALNKLFGIDVKEMQCLASSPSEGYYGVTKKHPEIEKEIIKHVDSATHAFSFYVKYGYLH